MKLLELYRKLKSPHVHFQAAYSGGWGSQLASLGVSVAHSSWDADYKRGTWMSLWVKKDAFQTLLPSWSLPGISPVVMPLADRLHCILASQWEVSASLSEESWFLERAKKALFIWAASLQTDAYPACNISSWYKRKLVIASLQRFSKEGTFILPIWSPCSP